MAIYPKDLLRLKKEERRMLRIEKRNNELGATERAKGTRHAILVGTESNLVGSELSSTSAALTSTSLSSFAEITALVKTRSSCRSLNSHSLVAQRGSLAAALDRPTPHTVRSF